MAEEKKKRSLLGRGAKGVLLLVVVVFVWNSSILDVFLFNRGRYNRVIERARVLTSATAETVYFPGDWEYDIAPMPGGDNICARRLEDGALFVRILVRDYHRMGKWGYVYSEVPADSARAVERDLDSYGCGEWTVTGKIFGSWWYIENNLG